MLGPHRPPGTMDDVPDAGSAEARRSRGPRGRRLRRVAILAVVLVVAALAGPPLTSPQLRDDAGSAQGCTDVTFYGIRGTGQATDDATRGFGRETASVAEIAGEDLRAAGATVSHRSADYPASAANDESGYDASVATGTRAVVEDLVDLVDGCPDTEVVVLGFSQGAQVAHLALGEPGQGADADPDAGVPPEVVDRVRAVVLVADPLRSLDDPAVTLPGWGGEPTSGGFDDAPAAPRIDPALTGRVLSPCYTSDPICHADGRRVLGMLTHAFAYEWGPAEDRAADWVVDRLTGLGPS